MQAGFYSLATSNTSSSNAKAQKATTKNPIDEFLKWFDQQSGEQQVELSEFIGFFCYRPLFSTFLNNDAKIYALRVYLNSFRDNLDRSIKILQFIDQVINFIVDINKDSESDYFNWEELVTELPGISCLYSLIIDLPARTKRWAFTFVQWQHFKATYQFFRAQAKSNSTSTTRSRNSQLHPDPIIVSRNGSQISKGSPIV